MQRDVLSYVYEGKRDDTDTESAGGKGKRKREIEEGEDRFTGDMFRLDEPPRRIMELNNYNTLVNSGAITGDPVRDLWLSKCIDAAQNAMNKSSSAKENESKDKDTCVSTFTVQLLACFETSAYKELRTDLDKYNGIMDLFSSNIEERLNEMSARSSALKAKLLSPIHKMNKRQTKMSRKAEAGLLLLDRCGHAHVILDGDFRWTDTAITCRGASFKLSLRVQEAPGVSSLLFKASVPADILSSYKPIDITNFLLRPLSAEFNLIVMSSHRKAILLQASCAGGTDNFVMERHVTDYLVMGSTDLSPPTLTRLPVMPSYLKNYCGLSLMCQNNSYVVAALEQGSKEWNISLFSSSANSWCRKRVRLTPELSDWNHWEVTGVLVCSGRFWWIDLRRGALSCSGDQLLQENGTQPPLTLEFTLLPDIGMEMAKEACLSTFPLMRDQCISASGGCLRYVTVRAPRYSSAVVTHPLCDDCRGGCVTCWVLDDATGAWAEEHMVKLADIWKEDSYVCTGLPKEVPEFPLVDPFDPNIIYFSIKGGLGNGFEFGINLSTRLVQTCSNTYRRLYNVYDGLEPVFTSGGSSERQASTLAAAAPTGRCCQGHDYPAQRFV